MGSLAKKVVCLVLAAIGATACGVETEASDDGDTYDQTTDALQSSPLASNMMTRIATPAGMPTPWDQPDSGGWFDERGKCGPTAVANALKLYGIDVSPAQADADGVNWLIGSRGINVESYMKRKHPRLGCTLEHPVDNGAFLRTELDAGHPVMLWFNTEGGFSSHWVTAVGHRGRGAAEVAIVMSWGRYYSIPMDKLLAAWRNVYGIRSPSVVCDAKTSLIAK